MKRTTVKLPDELDAKLRQVERTAGYPHQTRAAWKELPVDAKSRPQYLQGSVVAIENLTGAVLAIGLAELSQKNNRAGANTCTCQTHPI